MTRGTGQSDRAERSLGLGLYIVDHIVQALGGSVELNSNQVEGTTFSITLPRSASKASDSLI